MADTNVTAVLWTGSEFITDVDDPERCYRFGLWCFAKELGARAPLFPSPEQEGAVLFHVTPMSKQEAIALAKQELVGQLTWPDDSVPLVEGDEIISRGERVKVGKTHKGQQFKPRA